MWTWFWKHVSPSLEPLLQIRQVHWYEVFSKVDDIRVLVNLTLKASLSFVRTFAFNFSSSLVRSIFQSWRHSYLWTWFWKQVSPSLEDAGQFIIKFIGKKYFQNLRVSVLYFVKFDVCILKASLYLIWRWLTCDMWYQVHS